MCVFEASSEKTTGTGLEVGECAWQKWCLVDGDKKMECSGQISDKSGTIVKFPTK